MVDLRPNCFTIKNNAAPMKGVQLVEGVPIEEGMEYIQGTHAFIIPFGDPLKFGVGFVRGLVNPEAPKPWRLMRAQFDELSGRLMPTGEDTRTIYVKIVARDLVFGFDALAKDLNIWAGGDGGMRSIVQAGSHNDAHSKEQLYRLRHGESIFIVDTKTAIIEMHSVAGRPVFSTVSARRLATLFRDRAFHQRSIRSYDWAAHNLRSLLESNPTAESVINNALSEIDRWRSEA